MVTVRENTQFIEQIIQHSENRLRFIDEGTELDELYDYFRVQLESKYRKSLSEIGEVLKERLVKGIANILTTTYPKALVVMGLPKNML